MQWRTEESPFSASTAARGRRRMRGGGTQSRVLSLQLRVFYKRTSDPR